MKSSDNFRLFLKNFILVSLMVTVTGSRVEDGRINPIKIVKTFATLFFGGNPGPSHPLTKYRASALKSPIPIRTDSTKSHSTKNSVKMPPPNVTLSSADYFYNLASKLTRPLAVRLLSNPKTTTTTTTTKPPAERGLSQTTTKSNKTRVVKPKAVSYYKPFGKLKQHFDFGGKTRTRFGRGQGLSLNIRQNLLRTPMKMQFSSSNHVYNIHPNPLRKGEQRGGKVVKEESDTNNVFTTQVVLENLLQFLRQEFPAIAWNRR